MALTPVFAKLMILLFWTADGRKTRKGKPTRISYDWRVPPAASETAEKGLAEKYHPCHSTLVPQKYTQCASTRGTREETPKKKSQSMKEEEVVMENLAEFL